MPGKAAAWNKRANFPSGPTLETKPGGGGARTLKYRLSSCMRLLVGLAYYVAIVIHSLPVRTVGVLGDLVLFILLISLVSFHRPVINMPRC